MTPAHSSIHHVLKAGDIRKSFGKKEVLRGASMDLQAGELAGLVGENGSGKSTLLRILVGALSPDVGKVSIEGRPAYCPQKPLLFEDMTVLENFRYFAAAYGLLAAPAEDKTSWEEQRDHLLRFFHFDQHRHERVRFLSGGTQQKLNLCISLLPDANLLLLDEPYAGFDWETYLHFWEYSTSLLKKGRSILVVTHFIHDQARFDRIFELKNGQLNEKEPRIT